MPTDEPISNFTLVRIAVLKEIRTTFRERSQTVAVLVAIAMLIAVMTMFLLPAIRSSRERSSLNRKAATPAAVTQTSTTEVAPAKPTSQLSTAPASTTQAATGPVAADDSLAGNPRAGNVRMSPDEMQWVAVGVASFVGFFFSVGYLFAAVLATFVGEKEGRTLEVLLACPMTDRSLYLLKCFSVLVPSAALAALFSSGSMAIAGVAVNGSNQRVPASIFVMGPLLGIPLMVLGQTWFVGLGAAISARAETMKGAGQSLGITLLIICGSLYGIPATAAHSEGLQETAQAIAARFLEQPFAVQYLLALAGMATPAVALLLIGRLFFRRDRMLT